MMTPAQRKRVKEFRTLLDRLPHKTKAAKYEFICNATCAALPTVKAWASREPRRIIPELSLRVLHAHVAML